MSENQIANVVTDNTALSDSVFSNKDEFNQLLRVASAFSRSELVPQNYRGKAEDCLIAIDMANRMGIAPLMVMQNLYVVKGKPSWSGQACMALINGCGRFRNAVPNYIGTEGADDRGCYVSAERVSDGATIKGATVSIQMAKAEGWMSNSKWKNMPELMLAYRAAAFFARVNCPEALMGVQIEGEVEDIQRPRKVDDVL